MKNQHKIQRKSNIVRFCLLTLIITCVFSFIGCSEDKQDNKKNKNDITSSPTATENTAIIPPIATPEVTQKPVEIVPTYEVPQVITVDELKDLESRNSDFVFWFYIPSEIVKPFDYPVMQRTEPENKHYYIDKNFDKEDSAAGTLYLDYKNNADTMEGHTIIYGHNQSDGSMFGNLLRYYQDEKGKPIKSPDDDKFLCEHPYIYTFSEKETIVWKIFSVYDTTAYEDYIKREFASESEYFLFIKDLKEKSYFDVDVDLKPDDDVLTLSTCYRFKHPEGRLTVHAVRVQTTPTK